jgi:GDP-L-fucose synthase
MPTNLYGPGDNYHPENSHVLPAMIRRFHEAAVTGAQEVRIWGTGTPLREFLHVNDLAAAILHLLQLPDPPDLVNVGSGQEISILELAQLVARVVGYSGRITTDPSKPDGTPRKLSDIRRIQSTGWQPRITLEDGIRDAWQDFLKASNNSSLRNI